MYADYSTVCLTREVKRRLSKPYSMIISSLESCHEVLARAHALDRRCVGLGGVVLCVRLFVSWVLHFAMPCAVIDYGNTAH